MSQNKMILLGVLACSLLFFYKIRTKKIVNNKTIVKQEISINNKRGILEAEKQALRDLVPNEKWMADVKKNDVQTLKKIMKKKTGLDIKELRENPDGSYNATLSSGRVKEYKKVPLMDKKEFSTFRNDFIRTANKGKEVIIDDKDLEAIRKFRSAQ